MAEKQESIVLFPFMAQGHIIPFLALALHLEQRNKNHNIVLINTPLNIKKLKSSLPLNSSSIKLLQIPFNSSHHDLPPNTENTDTVPYNLVFNLIQASTTIKPSFKQFIQNLIIPKQQQQHKHCIIADIFFGWTASVAKELGVFHVVFGGCSGYGVPILGWSMAAEQFFNCKLLEEEIGVCVEVARGKSCEVKNEDIVSKIELVMSEMENGMKMRENAGKIRDMIRNAVKDEDEFKGPSVKAIDDFLSAALL